MLMEFPVDWFGSNGNGMVSFQNVSLLRKVLSGDKVNFDP